jgi:hypothetical protein
MIGFIGTLYTQYSELQAIPVLSLFCTLSSSPLHSHKDSQSSPVIFWQRISRQSHCHFRRHVKSSFHSLIPFWPIFCNCQLNLIPLLPSLCPGRLVSRNLIQFFSTEPFFINIVHGPRRKHISLLLGRRFYSSVAEQRKLLDCCLRICCRGDLFSESLLSNERILWFHYSGFRASCHHTY